MTGDHDPKAATDGILIMFLVFAVEIIRVGVHVLLSIRFTADS